ncbi:serine hydrolase domain-containing protein [Pendulispora albinea]|uniref:Beta-lactamase family protein n=1 Tax=Pendulispora albinea TaxID=2741071 RepID=A0ABZ2LJR7_9BACT
MAVLLAQGTACEHSTATTPPTPAPFRDLEQRTRSTELPNVHSVLVLQHGKPLAEWYVAGVDEERGRPLGTVNFDASTLHDTRSVSKSVVSLLFGIAISEQAVKSLDTPVLDYFPEYTDLRTPDRMKIRVRDMLTMTSGLTWNEDLPYTDPRNSETAMDMAPDRYRYVLEQPIATPAGQTFTYSGGDVAVAAAILARATKTPMDVYAQQKLWAPLGITQHVWLKDGKGVPYAASGLRLTPRDMLKIGQMMLEQGRWNGQQVVPAAWVADSIAPHAQAGSDPKCGTRYGYFWWLSPGCVVTPPAPYYAAQGNGGQRIWVIPSRDLVVVMTAGNYNQWEIQGKVTNAVLSGVLAAVPE